MNEDELIYGDIRSLVQIINVLISNSIQSYVNGNGIVDVSIIKDIHNIQIAVKDNGQGIPENIQQKLLNKMVTTKGSKGTGIGLYISNSIIKAKFGGSISFESKDGYGSTFNIILPLKKAGQTQ
jgi:signal transduction histidine kinase